MRRNGLGTVTIGEAPRPDLVPLLARHVPAHVRQIHKGVLDGLRPDEIAARFDPEPGEPVLVTRLRSGGAVTLSRARAERAVQQQIDALADAGAAVILLLCTGSFAGLSCPTAWLIEPDRIIPPLVGALLGARRLGVIVPLAAQIASESEKWRTLAEPPLLASASPYEGDLAAVAGAAGTLARRGAKALLLDCIGFAGPHREAAAASGLPVLLSNTLVAKAVGELF